MKKIIKLNESDIHKMVKRTINRILYEQKINKEIAINAVFNRLGTKSFNDLKNTVFNGDTPNDRDTLIDGLYDAIMNDPNLSRLKEIALNDIR